LVRYHPRIGTLVRKLPHTVVLLMNMVVRTPRKLAPNSKLALAIDNILGRQLEHIVVGLMRKLALGTLELMGPCTLALLGKLVPERRLGLKRKLGLELELGLERRLGLEHRLEQLDVGL
jgi:hypothetical protein